MATSWKNVRAAKTMRKSGIILDLEANKTDKEIWENFNNRIDTEEVIVSDYMAEFCSALCESKIPMRLSLITEYLPLVVPTRKQELALFAATICINHDEKEKALENINTYKETYGTDKEILIEELSYYTAFDSENIDKISSLVEKIENYKTV